MSLSPAQVRIFVEAEPFRSALIRAVKAINDLPPELLLKLRRIAKQRERDKCRALVHRTRVQYRRKSRGHR